MPRAAAAGQEIAPFAISAPALEAPTDLTAEQAEDWRRITGAFSPEHFDGGNEPLLRQLVEHISYSKQIAEELAALRRARLNVATVRGEKVRAAYRQLLQMARAETHAIVQLSTKLRLSNSAHRTFDPRRGRGDGRLAATLPSGPKPWEQ
jgi:hypothetical protein